MVFNKKSMEISLFFAMEGVPPPNSRKSVIPIDFELLSHLQQFENVSTM